MSDDQTHVRDSRQPGHFWADNEIVDQYLPEIGVYGYAVYMLLCRYADSKTGQCDPSVSGMAVKLGISTPTVRAALDKLKDTKLITIRHRSKEYDGKRLNQTSVYTILAVKKGQRTGGTKGGLVPSDIDQGTKGDLPGVLNQVDQGTKPPLVGVLNQVSTNNTHGNKTHLTTPTTKRTPNREMVMMLMAKGVKSSKVANEIAMMGLDFATVEQSIDNLLADNQTKIEAVIGFLRTNPPEKDKPYPRATPRASPKNGIPTPTKPIRPPDMLTPAQIAERSKAKRAERDTS